MGVNLAVRGMDRGFCSFFNILSHFVCGYQQKKVSLSQFFRRVMRLRMAYYIILYYMVPVVALACWLFRPTFRKNGWRDSLGRFALGHL